jgi:hypothetical protein
MDNKTNVLVFENFDISKIKEEDRESLGNALVDYLSEINGKSKESVNLLTYQYGNFVVKAEVDESLIPNGYYKGIILKITTHSTSE